MKSQVQKSPIRGKGGKPTPSDFNIVAMARQYYKSYAIEATNKLMEFLSAVLPTERISIMYFDEAHELGLQFWIFLRLVQHQLPLKKMWYTFMGTKSKVSYYAPRPSERQCTSSIPCTCLTEELAHSLQLKGELNRLLPPYIDLGFDQQAIARSEEPVRLRMGDMETIEFISQYGRPMYVDFACKPQLLILLSGGAHIYLNKHQMR